MRKRIFLLAALWPVFVGAKDRPNVLLICIDDLRPELKCFGLDYIHSPNIDELAVDAQGKPGELAVALSALLPACADPLWHEHEKFESIFRDVSAQRDAPSIVQLLDEVDHQFAEFAPVLKLATPAKSLVDWHNDDTVE